jgi:hypothetical protein
MVKRTDVRAVLVVAAAGLLLAWTAPTAGADTLRVKTSTTVNIEPTGVPGQAKYSGKVKCKPPKGDDPKERAKNRRAADECEDERLVGVYHGSFLIGTAKTDKNGEWEVIGNKPPAGDVVRVEIDAEKIRGINCRPKTKRATVNF